MRRRLNLFNREHESLTTNNRSKAPSTSALLAEKRALTTDEQDYIINSAEEEILLNDKIAHFAFLFLILLEGFVFFFFSISDLRTYVHRADVSNSILEGGEGGATIDRLLESSSHFVVSCLAFVAAFLTSGRRSLRRISGKELANKLKLSATKKSVNHISQTKLEMKYDDRHEDIHHPLPPPTAAFPPPPPPFGGISHASMPPPPVFPSAPTLINSTFDDLVEGEVQEEDEEDIITIALNTANIARVRTVHRVVAALSILVAAPLLFSSTVMASTHESPFSPTKVLLYLWQPLQHLLLDWATKALVEDVMESVGQLKKTKYKHQDA